MIQEIDITKAWAHIRRTNCVIPDHVLDFMKLSAIEKIRARRANESDEYEKGQKAKDLRIQLNLENDTVLAGLQYQKIILLQNRLVSYVVIEGRPDITPLTKEQENLLSRINKDIEDRILQIVKATK